MAGNVWEWTSTRFKNYRYNSKDDREDLEAGHIWRVLRGGSWLDYRDSARCSYRLRFVPLLGSDYSGFRVVVSPIL
jgi:formylglycine-generating enzyme required for sulfatase activity